MESIPTAKPLTPLERDPLKEDAISVFVLHYSGEVVKVEKNLMEY